MNRHSSLFRVAFLSLIMALGLPLLVFVAANVRHKQLQSTANPRWAQFRKINGPGTPEPQTAEVPTSVVATTKPLQTRTADSNRITAKLASQSHGMTGSATGSLPQTRADDNERVSVEIPPSAPSRQPVPVRTAQLAPGKLSPQQMPGLQPTPKYESPVVPLPDDVAGTHMPQPMPPRVRTTPTFKFQAVEDSPAAGDQAASRIEARLAGMQRRLDQLAQVQADDKVSDMERVLEMLQKNQQTQQGLGSQQRQAGPAPYEPPDFPAPNRAPVAPAPAPMLQSPPRAGGTAGTAGGNGGGREPSIKIVQGDAGDHDERFSIQVQDANLTEVLEMLGQLAGVNILASPQVQDRVSLNLQDVTVDRALDAILKSQGFVHERDGDFIYVRSTVEDAAMKQANRKLITKVYQLHYINVNEVQKLLDPVMTKGIGRHAVTSPALTGIAPSQTTAGGDGLSQRDTLLVQDYPEVIAEIDRIIIELDVPPLQVMIEAKILSVILSDSMTFGVNFAMLNGAQNSQLLSGNGSTLNGSVGFPANPALVPAAGDFIANTAGLKYGFIQGDISGFIKALESIADTTLVAAPQLRVLNKQKAEMIIGQRLSYKTLAFNGTQTVENVQFLDAGTKLIFRPFISPDGLVRLEVHPERSKATINQQTGLPNSETTEVTTNVMVRDGTTVVLGGLISEESVESIDRVPFLGALPLVGAAFRNKTESVQRNELIVLITPRIVTEPEAAIEGEKLQFETQERAAYFRDKLSPVNRNSLTRAHYERAVDYFDNGNLLKAKQQIEAALVQNKGDLECQRLKLKIDQSLRERQAKAWHWPMGSHRTTTRKMLP